MHGPVKFVCVDVPWINVVLIVFLTLHAKVIILLMVADWLVHFVWRWGFDPDNIAIPFLTALGDLLGTGLLSASFAIMWQIGDHDEDVGE